MLYFHQGNQGNSQVMEQEQTEIVAREKKEKKNLTEVNQYEIEYTLRPGKAQNSTN